MLYPALKTLVSYHFVRISLLTDCLPQQKLAQKFAILTCAYRLIVASQRFIFVVHWGRCQEGYLPVFRLYKEHAHNLEYKLDIHVNFDHAWAEYYSGFFFKVGEIWSQWDIPNEILCNKTAHYV